MSIVTKTGDKGETGLWSGQRIPKDDIRVEAYGTIDELNSFLGEAKHFSKNPKVVEIIEIVQRDLFKVAGQLATIGMTYADPVKDEDVDKLTNWVTEFETQLKLKGFVIPGSTVSSAKLDICRTVARRAERRIVTLSKTDSIDKVVILFMNRLSDLLYIMARFEEGLENKIKFKNNSV